ncbi:MAG: hypothetical protein AAB900_00595 [Patescibacteria group bacterium]
MSEIAGLTVEQATGKIFYALASLRMILEAKESPAVILDLTSQELDCLEDQLMVDLTDISPYIISIREEAEAQAGAMILEIMLVLDDKAQGDNRAITYVLNNLIKSYLVAITHFQELFSRETQTTIKDILKEDSSILAKINNLVILVSNGLDGNGLRELRFARN